MPESLPAGISLGPLSLRGGEAVCGQAGAGGGRGGEVGAVHAGSALRPQRYRGQLWRLPEGRSSSRISDMRGGVSSPDQLMVLARLCLLAVFAGWTADSASGRPGFDSR